MTPRLNKDFKKEASVFLINTAKQLIAENFDIKDKKRCTINVVNDKMEVEISKNCFPDTENRFKGIYFEDYYVFFKYINITTTKQTENIWSVFYLEWKDNDMNTELNRPKGDGQLKIHKYYI